MMFERYRDKLVVFAVTSAIAQACNDDHVPAEECYPPDPMLEGPLHAPPFCRWKLSEIPEGPPGTNTYTRGICVPAGPGGDCSPCDVERIDALVKAKIAEDCCQPIEAFIRGCYWPRIGVDGTDECCYAVVYASKCEEPATGGVCQRPPED